MSKFTLNETDQRERAHRVAEYLKKERLLDVRNFGCCHIDDCKPSCGEGLVFTEGQLHYIGEHYSLLRDGKPFRVVVVGEQYGDKCPTDLVERQKSVHNCHHLKPNSMPFPWQQKDDENNPHMTGTLLALRFLFERPFPLPFSKDDSNLDVGGHTVSIFDCFALTNYLLCSATPEKGSSTKATPTMWEKCRKHIAAMLHILQPTHLVLQGTSSVMPNIEHVTGPLQKHNCKTINIFGVETHVFSFYHPSARDEKRWGIVTEESTTENSYLRRVVEPVIKSAIK